MGRISGFNSSSTLVDIVASIWSLGTNTIAKVKSVTTDVWNGVKAVGSFILDIVFGPIVEKLREGILNVAQAMLETVNQFIPLQSMTFTSTGFSFTVNGQTVTIELLINSDLSLQLIVNSESLFKIKTPYFIPKIETLSITNDDALAAYFSSILSFIPLFIAGTADEPFNKVLTFSLIGGFIFIQLVWLLTHYETTPEADQKDLLSLYATILNLAGNSHFLGVLLLSLGTAGGIASGKIALELGELIAAYGVESFALTSS
ncbi:MAG: hypothetical protein ACXAC2_18200, partial [Candidatus Kariarchaeaceae archaeon]